ncbi:hypothetical protein FPV153 [Fowlpox virus]|nr:hypothetical protein FPV153 [Fowlpox virus]AYO90005.1 hypothetical protein FPV153 [Fowlpox virus]
MILAWKIIYLAILLYIPTERLVLSHTVITRSKLSTEDNEIDDVPTCPYRMFNKKKIMGPIVSVKSPDNPTGPIMALDAYHNYTSCKYNQYCTFFNFCMAGNTTIRFGRQKINLIYFVFIEAVTRDDYTKITQEVTLKHLDDVRFKPVSVTFAALYKQFVKMSAYHECNKTGFKKPVRDSCRKDSNSAIQYSNEQKSHYNFLLKSSKKI